MGEIWLTSDTHFFHEQDFIYAPRGFQNVREMNEAIVERWNSLVKPEDLVYHLGDVVMGHYDTILFKRLNGTILLVQGNHDTDNKLAYLKAARPLGKFCCVGSSATVEWHKMKLFLCHYPVLTANFDDKHFSQHVINFHGHTHQTTNWLFPDNPFIYHVGLDSHDCYPVSLTTALQEIRNRWNELGQLNITPHGIYN